MRKKTIEGWKDARFSYVVNCGWSCSFSGYSPITKDCTRYSNLFSDPESIQYFESEQVAQEYIDSMMKKAEAIKNEYIQNMDEIHSSTESYEKFLKKHNIDINSVLLSLIDSMTDEQLGEPMDNGKFILEVGQAVLSN